MAQTGLVYHEAYLDHDTGEGHVERPERLRSVMNGIAMAGILDKLKIIKPRPAAVEELALVHDRQYIKKVEVFSQSGGGTFMGGNMVLPVPMRLPCWPPAGL